MIDLTLLSEKDHGRWVLYRSSGGDKVQPGRLKSFNARVAFVVYAASDNWDEYRDYTAAATRPEDLEFLT